MGSPPAFSDAAAGVLCRTSYREQSAPKLSYRLMKPKGYGLFNCSPPRTPSAAMLVQPLSRASVPFQNRAYPTGQTCFACSFNSRLVEGIDSRGIADSTSFFEEIYQLSKVVLIDTGTRTTSGNTAVCIASNVPSAPCGLRNPPSCRLGSSSRPNPVLLW